MLQAMTRSKAFHLVILLSFYSFIVFYNLGENAFRNADESFYALTAREMVRTGDWLTPRIDNEIAFSKPPLMTWLTAMSISAFGFSEFSARLPAATFGILTLWLTYLFAEALFDRKTAFLASLMLATCYQFLYFHSSKTGEFDSAIAFLVLLSIYFIFQSHHQFRFFYFAWASIGAIFMVKPPLIIVPFCILILDRLVTRRLRDIRMRQWMVGAAIFALVALPWHIFELILHGKAFIDLYVFDQMIGRRVGPEMSFVSGLEFYGRAVFMGFYPWSIVVPFATVYCLTSLHHGTHRNQNVVLMIQVVMLVLLFSAVPLRYPWYINPMYPALAILNGVFMIRFLVSPARSMIICSAAAAMVLSAAVLRPNFSINPFATSDLRIPATVSMPNWLEPIQGKISVGGVVIVALAALGLAWVMCKVAVFIEKRHPILLQRARLSLLVYLGVLAIILSVLPLRFSDRKSAFYKMNREMWRETQADTDVVFYGNRLPNLRDYIYFYDFQRIKMKPIINVGLDDKHWLREVSSGNRKLSVMEAQHFYDLRHKWNGHPKFSMPWKEFEGWVFLSSVLDDGVRGSTTDDKTVLTEKLEDHDSGVRRKAAIDLGRFGETTAVDGLVRLLNDRDDKVVEAAARALGDIRVSSAAEYLKKAAERFPRDGETHRTISLALAYLRDRSTVPFLVDLYRRNPLYEIGKAPIPNPPEYKHHDKYWTAYLLVDIEPDVGTAIISEDVYRYVERRRQGGMPLGAYDVQRSALYRVGSKIALDLILQMLEDEDELRRMIAVWLLGKPIGPHAKLSIQEMERSKRLLRKRAEADTSPKVRRLAGEVLERYHEKMWLAW